MKCKFCGGELPNGSNLCEYCGSANEKEKETQAGPAPVQEVRITVDHVYAPQVDEDEEDEEEPNPARVVAMKGGDISFLKRNQAARARAEEAESAQKPILSCVIIFAIFIILTLSICAAC